MPATKQNKPAVGTFQLTFKVSGELAIEIQATSIEEAIQQGKSLSFTDVVSYDYDNIDLNQPDLIGAYRMGQ